MRKATHPNLFNPDLHKCWYSGHAQTSATRSAVFVGESVGDPVALVTVRYFVGDTAVTRVEAVRHADNKALYNELLTMGIAATAQ